MYNTIQYKLLMTLSKEGFAVTIIILICKIGCQNDRKSKNYKDTMVYVKRVRKLKNSSWNNTAVAK